MRSNLLSFRFSLIGGMVAALALNSAPVLALPFLAQTTFGGAGDEGSGGVAANSSGVYFTGSGPSGSIVGQSSLSLGPSPVWSRAWPGTADGYFSGGALTPTGVIVVGSSHTQTVDTVGDKEGKGITVKFNSDGSAGGGAGGAVWSRQTPGAPGGFPYGGIEWLTGVTTVIEGGQTRIYTAGLGQPDGVSGNVGRFVTKLDESGNILWSRTDATTITHPPAGTTSELWGTRTTGIAATGDSLYVASRKEVSGVHPDLKKYDSNGNLLWTRTSVAPGEYRAVGSAGGKVYAVGQTNPDTANPDFLLESWDDAGNLLWSRTYDRSSSEDILNGVVIESGHLFAVGSTKGGTAGGTDGILLEIDALTGNLLDSTLWGGTANDMFNGLAVAGSTLYAVGSTLSFGAGGSDIAIASFALPSDQVPEPGTLFLTSLGMVGLGLAGQRKRRDG